MGREVGMLFCLKASLEDVEKPVWECEPGPPKPAAELLLPKAGAPGPPAGPPAMDAGNPDRPGDPKPEAAGVLNENEAADVILGFPNPRAGAEVVTAEVAEGAAPNAGGLPNAEGLPEGVVENPGFVLKLKFWALSLLLLFTGKPKK